MCGAAPSPGSCPRPETSRPRAWPRSWTGRAWPCCGRLDVGTGSGYGCAILARRLGGANVTSIDIDPYLTRAAAGRLASQGICPRIITADAAAGLDWAGDRIIAMVAVPAIPPSWLAALRTGGRLVTTIAGTSIIITASKTPDGGAWGKIEWDRAGFMNARSPAHGLPPACPAGISEDEGQTATGRYPVIDVENARELRSLLELALPGITHTYQEDPDGCRTASMTCPDGSWATAAGYRGEPAQVRHGGPRNPWEALDRIRDDWLADGCLPLYGAEVRIDPGGTSHLTRGTWHATIPPAAPLQTSTRPPP